ncbi:MAG: hypothetical protein AAFU64_11525, partial [Bacteroidota bacterium]
MKTRLIQFFDTFVQDFTQFEGDLIAERYVAPYTAIHSEGQASLYPTHQDIGQYFSKILAAYESQEVDHCSYESLTFASLGENTVIAT